MFALNTLILFISALIALYFYLTRNHKYWSSRGIDGPKPVPLLGTFYQAFSKSFGELFFDNSRKYGKVYGTYFASIPKLTIADPILLKDILIKDFNKFVDRNDFVTGDALNDRSLPNIMGEDWKKMRTIISPTFSSGKMRSMHPIIVDCVKRLEEYLETKVITKDINDIELKKVMANLTLDVIASCAFGIKMDIFNEKTTNKFIENAAKVLPGVSWRFYIFFLLLVTFPKILKWTGFEIRDPEVSKYFRDFIQAIISKRRAEKVKHKDYLQLVIDAQNKALETDENETNVNKESELLFGQLEDNTNERLINGKEKEFLLSDDDILANSLTFLVAGHETTASLISYVFYSLALDEECQQRLYEEVNGFEGNYNYENISQMPYLEACVAETLRLYSPVAATGRIALEDYKLGDTGITIPKGMMLDIDIQSLHHSEEYYPNPKHWDPMRFMSENRDKLTPYTYMPFGIGPRNCVGMRFALMEAKTAIAHLVNKFHFVRTGNTRVPLKPKKFHFILNVGEINVGIEKRAKN